jgi:hypothetical protein
MKAMLCKRDKIIAYEKRLEAIIVSRNEEDLEQLCFDIELDQTWVKFWPKDVFDFCMNALNDKRIRAMSEGYSFIFIMNNDFDKIKYKYKRLLLNFIMTRCESFTDEMLRHTTSDLIAWQLHPKKSVKIFYKWLCSNSPYKLHMAFVGFDILLRSSSLLNQKDISRVQQYIIAADSKLEEQSRQAGIWPCSLTPTARCPPSPSTTSGTNRSLKNLRMITTIWGTNHEQQVGSGVRR